MPYLGCQRVYLSVADEAATSAGTKDVDCIIAHISPALLLRGASFPARLLQTERWFLHKRTRRLLNSPLGSRLPVAGERRREP